MMATRHKFYEKGFWPLPCSKFVEHLQAWLPLELLPNWGIEYSVVEQRLGELMILAPYTYQQGWSAGQEQQVSVMEIAIFGDRISWLRYMGYNECRWLCYCHNNENWDNSTMRLLRCPDNALNPPRLYVKWLSRQR